MMSTDFDAEIAAVIHAYFDDNSWNDSNYDSLKFAERGIERIGNSGEVITIYCTDGSETPISVAYGTSLQKIHKLIEERCNLYNIWYAGVEHIRILFRTAMLNAVKVN